MISLGNKNGNKMLIHLLANYSLLSPFSSCPKTYTLTDTASTQLTEALTRSKVQGRAGSCLP